MQSCACTEQEMQHINDVCATYIPKSQIDIYLLCKMATLSRTGPVQRYVRNVVSGNVLTAATNVFSAASSRVRTTVPRPPRVSQSVANIVIRYRGSDAGSSRQASRAQSQAHERGDIKESSVDAQSHSLLRQQKPKNSSDFTMETIKTDLNESALVKKIIPRIVTDELSFSKEPNIQHGIY